MRLFITPLDTQLYRDGRPFEAGVEVAGGSNLLPYPRTIYGALRARILGQDTDHWESWPNTSDVCAVIGPSPGEFGSLTIRGPVLAQGHFEKDSLQAISPLYPVPKDIVRVKNSRAEYVLLTPSPKQNAFKDSARLIRLSPCLSPDDRIVEDVEERERYFLPHDYLHRYLSGEAPPLTRAEEVIRFEPHLGIGQERLTRTAKAGLLYTVNYVRLKEGVGFMVDVAGEESLLPPKGAIRLGGDSRPAEYTQIDESPWEDVLDEAGLSKLAEKKRFKACLITPAIFEKGWYPDFLRDQDSCLEGVLPDTSIEVRLVGACLGRPVFIGGFDIKGKHPREMRKAVPAGSVYFFQILNWDALRPSQRNNEVNTLLREFSYQSLADRTQPQGVWKEGFGLSLIGRW